MSLGVSKKTGSSYLAPDEGEVARCGVGYGKRHNSLAAQLAG
jgi:hypothetical protein